MLIRLYHYRMRSEALLAGCEELKRTLDLNDWHSCEPIQQPEAEGTTSQPSVGQSCVT
jgi:hypothetical protein